MIYNIPPFTGLKLAPETVIKIAGLSERVVGYKDSSAALNDFMKVLPKFKDTPFSVLQGATPQALPSLMLGADGFVPALAPCFPELFSAAYDAGISGDYDRMWKYDRLIAESSKILGMTKNGTAAAKYAISLRGFTRKDVIMPQDFTLPEDEARIREQVAKVDEMYAAVKAG